jgi:hypothetical protein
VSTDQRWAAYGVAIFLCGLWLGLGVFAILSAASASEGRMDGDGSLLLVALLGAVLSLAALAALGAGLVTVRRLSAGVWPWRSVAWVTGLLAGLSVAGAVLVTPVFPLAAVALGLQVILLTGWAALMWTPY